MFGNNSEQYKIFSLNMSIIAKFHVLPPLWYNGITKSYIEINSSQLMQDYINEIDDVRKALNRVRQERDEAEKEIDGLKDEIESLNKTLENKMEDFLKLKEVSFEETYKILLF